MFRAFVWAQYQHCIFLPITCPYTYLRIQNVLLLSSALTITAEFPPLRVVDIFVPSTYECYLRSCQISTSDTFKVALVGARFFFLKCGRRSQGKNFLTKSRLSGSTQRPPAKLSKGTPYSYCELFPNYTNLTFPMSFQKVNT